MPIYEYACQKCGHEFDALQKISDGALKKCPACGALRLKRLVSAPQFRLKGTGWYETDFKKDGKKRLADGAEPAAAAQGGAEAKAADAAGKGDKAGKAEKKAGKDKAEGAGTGEAAKAAKPTTGSAAGAD